MSPKPMSQNASKMAITWIDASKTGKVERVCHVLPERGSRLP